jgi:hypothetical protein
VFIFPFCLPSEKTQVAAMEATFDKGDICQFITELH